MNFKDRKTNKSKKEEKGVMGLKFMKRAEEKQKEALKAEASMAIDQIKQDEFMKASSKFGGVELNDSNTAPIVPVDSAKVMDVLRKGKPVESTQKSKKVTVSFGQDDLSNFNTETTKLIKTAKPTTDEEKIINSLFVADADQAAEEFE
jgi:U3 small nucleolar RNA-associated protein 14